MKIRNIAIALLCVSSLAYADEQKVTEVRIVANDEIVGNKGDILELVQLDNQPQFPGGINGLMQWLGENIYYPQECVENNIQGKVLVKFIVFKDGSVGNVEIVKSIHPLLDAEAERVVKALPKWTPGVLNGENVNVWYTLPINFKLQDDPRESESQKFVSLGDEALAQNNPAHAFAYYKEAFDILPSQFYLIEKCDSLLVGQPSKQEEFNRWAIARMLREAEKNWEAADDYIVHMISLQEKILATYPNDLDALLAMEFLYFQGLDFDKVSATAQTIYPLIPSSDVALLADVIEMDANGRYLRHDYQGVVNLVKPKLDLLFSNTLDNPRVDPMLEVADAYIMLGQYKDAKKVIDRIKAFRPDVFERIVELHAENSPETHTKFVELTK